MPHDATPVIDAADLALAAAGVNSRTGGFADLGAAAGGLIAPPNYEEKSVCRIKVPEEFAGPWVVTLGPIWGGVDQDSVPVRADTGPMWAHLRWGSGAFYSDALIDWGHGTRINVAGQDVQLKVIRDWPVGPAAPTQFRVSASITRGTAPMVPPLTYTQDLGTINQSSQIDVPIPAFAKRFHHAISGTSLGVIRSLWLLEGTPAVPIVRDLYAFAVANVVQYPRFPLPIPIPANAWGIRYLNAGVAHAVHLIYELAI